MANTYSWTINALDVYPSQDSLANVVYNIHWGLTATSSETDEDGNAYSATSIGTQIVEAPEADDFTEFDSLTQEIVEAWLEASDMDIDSMKESLDSQLLEKITPTSVTLSLPVQDTTEEDVSAE